MSVVVRRARERDLVRAGEITAEAYLADGLLDEHHDYVAELRDASRRASEATLLVAVEVPDALVPAGAPSDGVDRAGDAAGDGGRFGRPVPPLGVDAPWPPEAEGALLGSIAYGAHGTPYAEIARNGEVELRMLAVASEARGRGAGELLMRAALATALGEGYERVVLSTMPAMRAAQRMYERLGLERAPARDWIVEDLYMLVYTT